MSTPILQPGDAIIVSTPYVTDSKGNLDLGETHKYSRDMVVQFEAQGIKVLGWMAFVGLNAPQITAVIRGKS